jgi:hypothetical protein
MKKQILILLLIGMMVGCESDFNQITIVESVKQVNKKSGYGNKWKIGLNAYPLSTVFLYTDSFYQIGDTIKFTK